MKTTSTVANSHRGRRHHLKVLAAAVALTTSIVATPSISAAQPGEGADLCFNPRAKICQAEARWGGADQATAELSIGHTHLR